MYKKRFRKWRLVKGIALCHVRLQGSSAVGRSNPSRTRRQKMSSEEMARYYDRKTRMGEKEVTVHMTSLMQTRRLGYDAKDGSLTPHTNSMVSAYGHGNAKVNAPSLAVMSIIPSYLGIPSSPSPPHILLISERLFTSISTYVTSKVYMWSKTMMDIVLLSIAMVLSL